MEWKDGKPNSKGLYWVTHDEDEVRMILIISGFGNVLHYRVIYPSKHLGQTEYQMLANLACDSHSKIEIPTRGD